MTSVLPICEIDPMREEEIILYRDAVARFLDRHAAPDTLDKWRRAKQVPAEFWRMAGEAGLLCPSVPEAYGGPGGDFRHDWVVLEETGRRGLEGFGVAVHSSIVSPYLFHYATEAQKARWLPRAVSGETILAVAMTEPGAGSDLQGVRTRATRTDKGWRINGQKTFISNGQSAGLIVVVAKAAKDDGSDGIGLFLVEGDAPGFRRGTNLDKVGREAQDTSELFFDDVELPEDALLGGTVGLGFAQLMAMLPQERLVIACMGMAMMERALAETITYTKDRKAFGKRLIDLQNTQFKLADAKTAATASKAFLQHGLSEHLAGRLDASFAAMIKLFVTETEWKVIDDCVQLFGGYGYMNEYPIARIFRDARIDRVHGGASEVMRLIVGRTL
jgi:acyl-CoA dehydrogenase